MARLNRGRDRKFQAILPLKGKILNVEKARYDKMLGHEEIRAMITALGCGIGKDDFDASKLRYGKLILMTDADVDGSHIRTLAAYVLLRHMTELIKRGHVYIAQPPLYRIKKGKFEQYIKDDREYVSVMVKRASDGMVIRYGKDGGRLEGAALTKYMGQLNDYLGFFDKVQKRLRNDDVTQAFAELFAHEGKDSVRRVDFETPAKVELMRQRLVAMQKTYQFKNVGDIVMDEEHRSYSVSYTDAQGAVRTIDWALASAPESRQMLAKHAQIKEQLVAPFFIEYATKTKAEAAAEAAEEAEEIASEEGVAEIAAAPGDGSRGEARQEGEQGIAGPCREKDGRAMCSSM